MTADEALANAARILATAEDAPPAIAATRNETARAWLDMASLLVAREQRG